MFRFRSRATRYIALMMCTCLLTAFVAAFASVDIRSAMASVGTGWSTPFSFAVQPDTQTPRGVDIGVDAQGWPHIVRIVKGSKNVPHLAYTYQDDSGWHDELVAVWPESLPLSPRMALDKFGVPHVVYRDGVAGYITYAFRSPGGTWVYQRLGDGTSGLSSADIAVDSQGRPHIVYHHKNRQTSQDKFDDLHYATRQGNVWVYEVVDGREGYVSNFSIAIGPDDRPQISYRYLTGQSVGLLIHAQPSATGWRRSTVDFGQAHGLVGFDSSIAVGPDGNPHILYVDKNDSSRFIQRYAYRDNSGKWHLEIVDTGYVTDSTGKPRARFAGGTVLVGGDGRVRAAYGELGDSGSFALDFVPIIYAERINGVWVKQIVNVPGPKFTGPAMAIDAAGHAHVVYETYGTSSYTITTRYFHQTSLKPIAPSVLTATLSGASAVTLAWTDGSNDETGFMIQRHQGDGNWQTIAATAANATSYVDSAVVGGPYSYRIRAYRAYSLWQILSQPSNTATVSVPVQVVPPAPSNLTAAITSSGGVNLRWTDNAAYESGYRIERRTADGPWSEIARLAANATSYNDPAPGIGRHTYRVRAYNSIMSHTFFSSYSAEAVVTINLNLAPSAPVDLWATVLGSNGVRLDWRDMADSERGFVIERRIGAGDWLQIGTAGPNIETYTDTGLTSGTTYHYRVRAYSQILSLTMHSEYSNAASATPGMLLFPAAPSALRATLGEGHITVTWADNSTTEHGFKLERRRGRGEWEQVATLGANVTTYEDTAIASLSTYAYRVRAYQQVMAMTTHSAYSNEDSAFVGLPPVPAAPAGLSAQAVSPLEVRLSWIDNAGDEHGFKVERSTGGGRWTEIAVLGADSTVYNDTGLTAQTQYRYRVRAFRSWVSDCHSDYTAETAVTTPAATVPAAPSGLTATAPAADQIRLTWQDRSTNESGFVIVRQGAGGGFHKHATVGAGVTSWVDQGVEPGLVYTYRVMAYATVAGRTTYSRHSNEASASTTAPPPPAAPSALTATAVNHSEVRLTWSDNSVGEIGFNIERRLGSDPWTLADTAGANAVSHSDIAVEGGKTYSYRVRAVGPYGYSGYSNTVLATTPVAPPGTGLPVYDGTQSGWAEPELNVAYQAGLTYPAIMSNFQRQITREEFCTIAVLLYEKLTGETAQPGINPFVDTSNPDIVKAYNLGIVRGVSADRFAPLNNITRQEMCVMIYRALGAAGKSTALIPGAAFPFTDAGQIANWAINEVKFCYQKEIMRGTSPTTISPTVNTPREQAIVLVKRTFEAFR